MYYLKCANCGHLNQVKGEYLTFCSDCSKKLENNYSDWKNNNKDKTWDDFKQTMCISEDEMQKVSTKSKTKTRGLVYWIGFAIMIAIGSLAGNYGSTTLIKFFKAKKTSEEVLTKDWIKDTYGHYGLAVETPFKLTKEPLPIPENVRHFIVDMDVYSSISKKGFKVMISSVKYNPAVGQLNLQGAANGSISEMKTQTEATDFKYSEDYIYKNDISGLIQNGTFKLSGVDVEFTNVLFLKGLLLWQVFVAYHTDDDIGRKAARRVIKSIEIKEQVYTL